MYFSFFGSVECPENPILPDDELDRLIRREERRVVREHGWEGFDNNPILRAEPSIAAFERLCRRFGKEPVLLGEDGYLYAKAAVLPRKGQAILLVACPEGGWAELGIVAWPLKFTAPAAVPGSICGCSPRYGLRARGS